MARVPFRMSSRTGNISGFDTKRFIESMQKKSFLCDVKNKKHISRNIVHSSDFITGKINIL
jgi:hypothetical protein